MRLSEIYSPRTRLILATLVFGCALNVTSRAQAPASPSIFDEDPAALTPPPIPDRVEGFNRAVFKFNDGLYDFTLRPLSKGYVKVVPSGVRRGITRFFHNLAFPIRFAGNLLEGKVKGAAVETGRFLINTTGSLGFVAIADDIPQLKESPSDLGQAFATWGFGHGTYLILPVLGPTSVRDGVGQGISGYFLDPVHYVQDWKYRTGANVLRITNESPELMARYDQLKEASIDPYVALRDAYSAQRSRRKASDTELPAVPAAASALPAP